jgi:hypothetical protein
MTRSTLRRKAAGLGLAAVLAATLGVAIVGPAAAIIPAATGTITVLNPVTVPVGGTSAGSASIRFSENVGKSNAWNGADGAFSVEVTIADSLGQPRVSFVETTLPMLDKPDSITAKVEWTGPRSFKVTATASSTGQVESITVGGLKVKADGSPSPAATGVIKTTYAGVPDIYGDPTLLPSVGSVPGAAVGLSVTASGATSVVRGLTDQTAGSVIISETIGHPLAANQVIRFTVANDITLGVPAATFSSTPTVAANTVASGITATIQNVTTSSFEVKVGTAATLATGGQLTIANIRLTVGATATVGALNLVVGSTGSPGTVFSNTVTVANAVAGAATTLALYALPGTSVAPGGAVTLRAQLSVAMAGLPIVFQAKLAGATSFVTIGTVNTTATGTADLPTTVAANTIYQASFAGTASLGASASLPVAVSAVPSLSLLIAGGYKTGLTTAYGTAVSVPNGTYATLKATYGIATANVPVLFYQRIGKTAPWTFLSTGRTDATGMVVWSKVVKVPSSATGYDRYVYFKVYVASTASYGASTSNSVRAVAK